MAAGSQLENGIWALFVIAASIIVIEIVEDNGEDHMFRIDQCP
jgi:hypothetical protein